jgi:hypothetical protein
MANERLAKGPEDGPDYTETNGASWMPGFTCGGREGKVEGEEAEPFGSDAEEMSSRAGFARMLSFWKLMGPLIVRYKLVRKLPKGDVRDEELERPQGQKKCPLAVPQLGSCASSGRAWRLWAARHSRCEADPLRAQPLPRLLERAASKAADCTAFGHSGAPAR